MLCVDKTVKLFHSYMYMTAALFRSPAAQTKMYAAGMNHNVVIAHIKVWGVKQTNYCNLGIERWCLNHVRELWQSAKLKCFVMLVLTPLLQHD